MSFLTRVSAALGELRGNPLDNPAMPLSAATVGTWLSDLFGGGPTSAGVRVNEQSAMQLDMVFTCVSVLSNDLSTLKLALYKVDEKKRTLATGTPLYNLICKRPNPYMTAPVFWRTWYACAILTGNGYAEVQRDRNNAPVALWPLHPRSVRPRITPQNDFVYDVTGPTGLRTLEPDDVLHLRGLSENGFIGLSPIMAAKQTIGTAIAAQDYGGGFFGRGSRPSGLLTGPELKTGKTENLDAAKASWESANSGANQGKTAVLPNGWTWTAIGVTPEEAQFLLTLGFTRTQIAALFGLPPHRVGDTSRLSNSNHESSAREYATNTLRPWTTNGEAEIDAKLLPRTGQSANKYEVEHDYSEMIKADYTALMTGLSMGRQWGAVTINEYRKALKLDPVGPEGDVLIIPLNMVAADSVLPGHDGGSTPDDQAGSAGDGEPGANQDALPAPSDNEPLPKGNGGRNQRQLLGRMEEAYGPLVADACARLARRSKRDAEAVAQIFGPVCEAIATEARRQAAGTFRLDEAADLGTERAQRDYRAGVVKRSAEWKPESIGVGEAARAVRSIVLPIFREAGGHIALGNAA